MRLSAVILTRNEEANIERCLKSVRWADEIVVVDAESTDQTREIAASLGARVIVHPWEGAGAQYAFAIAQARGKWVLVVDADEEVTPELARAVQKIFTQESPFAAYRVKRVNYVLGRWLRYGGWQEWVVRLFRQGYVESLPTLHPKFRIKGKVGKLPFALRHYMATDFWGWWQRSFCLARSEAEVAFLMGERFNGWAVLGAFWKFTRRFVFKLGFLDGWAGFFACLQRFLYIAVKQACLLELQSGLRQPHRSPERVPFK